MSEKNQGSVLEEHQQLEQKKNTFGDLSDRSSDLTERSSELTERSSEGTERSSEGTERSSEGTERSSELTEKSSELTERSSELTEDLAQKTSDEEGNELFLRIPKHVTNLTSLTIQKEKTLKRLLASFQFSAEPLDLPRLKNVEQQLLKEFPLPKFQKVSSEAKETNSTEESELNSIKEPKNDPAIILPNQRIFESCLFYLAKEGKRATRFLFVIILYLVFDFGFKIENLESLKRKDLLQIKQNKFNVNTKKYFVTKRAKKNFDLIEQYLGKEYFTKELVYSDNSILSTSLARNFNKKVKTLAKLWNQSWTLQDFRFSFVRNILLYEEIELDQFSTHYGVSLPRIYQLRTQKCYSIENITEKISVLPYLKFLD